jgi:P-type conjugative transfer protein TrbG
MNKHTPVYLAAIIILGGCATHSAATPPLTAAELVNREPKPVAIPADPLDTLAPALRQAYLRGTHEPVRDGFTWEFPYNPHATETIYCSPLHVSEIVLGADEHITNSSIGDADRWQVNAAGDRILIKPTPPGHSQGATYGAAAITMPVVYSTNLIVETDKRTYHLMLQSTPHRWMEQVTFFYLEEITAARSARANALHEAAKRIADPPSPDALDFNYKVSGADVPWKPVQVFSDRSHTYIQFADSAALDGDMPALFAGDEKNPAVVNYQTRGSAYIADRVLTRAALAEGTGALRQVVLIESTETR